jgi:exopolysaccharide biosynthesis polyprenyl glycosylphosphotransferase
LARNLLHVTCRQDFQLKHQKDGQEQMKNLSRSISILFIAIALFAVPGSITKTHAAGAELKPQEASAQVNMPRSNAPEPSSFLLFGSGIFTMLMAFLRRAYHIGKRVMDIAVASIAVVILAPLCLLVAVLIKLTSKGPVFYSQIRSGKDGKQFEIYKFRTMRTDAEKDSGPVWAKAKDNRITPIGNFLRKSRVDEIPQFINVLKGDMSVIGPRPERPMFVETLGEQIGDYKKRLVVKPGITGLAQVYHRYDESIADVRKKVKYDILYIKNICFSTDILIILRTFRVILTGFGAR